MAAAEREAQARHGLHADHIGLEQCERAGPALLRECEQRRQQHRAGMAAHAAVDVVVVERMAGITVQQRGLLRRGAGRATDHGNAAVAWRIRGQGGQQLAIAGIVGARESGGEEIEQAVARGGDRGRVAQGLGTHDRFGERAREGPGR